MEAFTLIHVAISLAGILSGFVVLLGLLIAKRLDGWTALFLATTAATSVTGFFFPSHGVTPAIVVGVISLVVLAVAAFARYARNLAGAWRKTHVKYAFDMLTHAKSMLISPPDVSIEHLFPPYSQEKNAALKMWFEY